MKNLVIIRGAGDLASGIISHLHNCGFSVLALERPQPLAIRRLVSFSEAIWYGDMTVEGITAYRANTLEDVQRHLSQGHVTVTVDSDGAYIKELNPRIVVDATLTKKNITTTINMAPCVIGIGPGHNVGFQCHAAIESMRGHNMGRIYYEGSPLADTGAPGLVGGQTSKRVVYAPVSGTLHVIEDITAQVTEGDLIAKVDETPVYAPFTGLLRGMMRDGTQVFSGLKIADIDPRSDQLANCYTISDKARALGGSVLEAIFRLGGASI